MDKDLANKQVLPDQSPETIPQIFNSGHSNAPMEQTQDFGFRSHDSSSGTVLNNKKQRIAINPVSKTPIIPELIIASSTPVTQNIKTEKKYEDLETRRWRNESIVINIYTILGVLFSLWLTIEAFVIENKTGAEHFQSFFYGFGILTYVFLLRKSNMARRIVLVCQYITAILAAFTLVSPYGVTLSNLATLIFAVLVIVFFSLQRVKRHF